MEKDEITAGDVQRAYSDLMDLLDKTQWTVFKGPTGKMGAISAPDKNIIKADAAEALTVFNTALTGYVGKLGIK